MYTIYNTFMRLSKIIPVTELVWKELTEMRETGQTYNGFITEMIELFNKNHLVEDINRSLQ
jgi:hypothetical protein